MATPSDDHYTIGAQVLAATHPITFQRKNIAGRLGIISPSPIPFRPSLRRKRAYA